MCNSLAGNTEPGNSHVPSPPNTLNEKNREADTPIFIYLKVACPFMQTFI